MKIKEELVIPKKGDKVYVDSHYHISRGSDDVEGGLATIETVYEEISGGEKYTIITVEEHPGVGYNWSQFLSKKQEELKKQFGKSKAYPCPDIDTPWIEEGDIVNGKPYEGR